MVTHWSPRCSIILLTPIATFNSSPLTPATSHTQGIYFLLSISPTSPHLSEDADFEASSLEMKEYFCPAQCLIQGNQIHLCPLPPIPIAYP